MQKPCIAKTIYLLIWLGLLPNAFAKEPNILHPAWKSYVNTDYVRALAVDGDDIWIAGGGAKRHNQIDGEWTFYHPEHGLASNDTRALAITGDFVWLATAAGVSRYNKCNDHWRTYSVEDGLADYVVTSVEVDDGHNLIWFGTWDGGVSQYDLVRDKWKIFDVDDGLANNRVLSIAADTEDGCVWFGTWGGGVSLYEIGSGQWRTFNTKDGLAGDIVSSIAVDEEIIWFGTMGSGVSSYNKITKDWGNFNRENGLAGDDVSSILVDPHRPFVWVGLRDGGAGKYNKNTGKWQTLTLKDGLASNDVASIALTESAILFGTWGSGVSKLDFSNNQWAILKTPNEIPHNRVLVVTIDRYHELVWFGTEGGGAGSYDPESSQWRIYDNGNYLASNVVNSISIDDSRGIVWFGTTEGLQSFDPIQSSGQAFNGNNSPINSIVYSTAYKDEKIWCGSFGDRLRSYDLTNDEWYVVDDLYALTINSIVVNEGQGVLYLATNEGVVVYNVKEKAWRTLGSVDDFPVAEVKTIVLDKKRKSIWAGSWGGGAYRYDMTTHRWQVLNTETGLPSDYVIGLVLDSDGALWLGTEKGACRYDLDGGELQTFTTKDGLGHNFVLSIAIEKGDIWLGTWGGASRYKRDFY